MDHPLNWYAVYTKPRNEKKLVGRLQEKGIEAYIPLRKTLKQWSDRKKFVEEPLITSYAFVCIRMDQYQDVLNTPGAVRFIWFSGKPAVIPGSQIHTLKLITGSGVEIECVPDTMLKGSMVRITTGALKGFTGELVNFAGKHKVVLRIDHLDKVFLLTISHHLLVPLSLTIPLSHKPVTDRAKLYLCSIH
jgi:transcription antitermination factor NusG